MKKNKRLLTIFTFNWIMSILCVCMIDSNTDVPLIILLVCLGWNGMFTAVNVRQIMEKERRQ